MYNEVTNAENIKAKSATVGDEPPEITADHMARWNKLIAYVKEKGYAGKPELDHDPALRQKIFDEYNRLNPKDAIPISMVKPIQAEIQKYKAQALADAENSINKYGVNPFAPGTTKENFMQGISQEDNIFGQKTSQWAFPSAYINSKRVGFAPKVNMQQLLK